MTQTSIQKTQEKARLLNSCCIKGDYYKWSLLSPGICSMAAPGQFVDIQIPGMAGHILRRPFSICNADATTGILTIVYKVVGAGTRQMAQLPAGTEMNILGPLGHGFSTLDSQIPAVLVGGGYGCAAMLFTARMASVPPVILLGGRTAGDIILNDEFTQMGCDVRIATNDGSLGTQGFVTVLLEEILKNTPTVPVAACGPAPMLKAVGKLCENYKNTNCELSIDRIMCCGMGACFGCVLKVIDPTSPQGWKYVRACHEGPVFQAENVYWD